MSRARIEEFLFDDDNEQKIAHHGLTRKQVRQILDDRHVVIPNRRSRRGSYLIVGQDHGGAYVSVPVEPTYDPGLWRPITAWFSKKHERALLE